MWDVGRRLEFSKGGKGLSLEFLIYPANSALLLQLMILKCTVE